MPLTTNGTPATPVADAPPGAAAAASAAAAAEGSAPGKHPFRYGLVWLVVGIPAATVVAGIFTIWIATTKGDPPLTESYRKQGLAITAPSAAQPGSNRGAGQ